ncbi:SDR family oxidoreductase [Aeromonas diversa]|uniref:Oxidoreductase n=1 Tax=Aeromonas diversa CDC 2478-85 TaxID=1268237 RepID=N9U5X1_9GAMM|nr:SDR family oxidoreductase [Aeromonas diversa]ENY73769.1 oxidoreductase [Aeromonas diversa CDC 2478-85]
MTQPLIVITGASSGFGAACARLFAERGYPLLLLARRIERLEALGLPNTLCRQVDVTDRAALTAALAEAEARFGPADLIVNNAGQMLLGKLAEQDPSEWDRMLDVNVKGVLNGIHAVLPGMLARRHGTIINISSIAGRKTFPNHAAYCGTKFAVHAISENLREEVAMQDVRVITIAPGAAETELLSHTSSDEIKAGYDQWKEHMGGVISAQDIAEAVRFAYEQPQHLCIREIVLAATRQEP